MKNEFPILNYPGSKRNLLDFIDQHVTEHIPKDQSIFDIFAGSGSVSYFYKDRFPVLANDAEKYSSIILKALLLFNPVHSLHDLKDQFQPFYDKNMQQLNSYFGEWVNREHGCLVTKDTTSILSLYESFPCVWKETLIMNGEVMTTQSLRFFPFAGLFTTYYSGSYFGIYQSMEIDSIRYAIGELTVDDATRCMLLASLFYAMKESVFSKDGHMAQPLDLDKNQERLLKKRSISIRDKFLGKVADFNSALFVSSKRRNHVYHYTFEELLTHAEVFNDVGFIYADPPYTDMQYSRYFHLLNTLVNYDYPKMSLFRGKLSKGLYTQNRFQSPLSSRSNAMRNQIRLFELCKNRRIGLAFSFAYPLDPSSQPTDRYVLDIFELIKQGKEIFGSRFTYYTQHYTHSNNRNRDTKKVIEYLLIYTP